jgi:hypothetical protein
MLARGVGATNFPSLVDELALAKTAVRLAFTQLLSSKGGES